MNHIGRFTPGRNTMSKQRMFLRSALTLFASVAMLALGAGHAGAAQGDITTVAGTGAPGSLGDNGPAISAQLNYPFHLSVDGSGNLYIADFSNHRVRRVDKITGIITTIAGTGTAGSLGDNGPAISAQLNTPLGVLADGSGNLYIADFSNHRVRKVDASGNITTVAGTGVSGFSGDGGSATSAQLAAPSSMFLDGSGNLFITDESNHRVRRVDKITGIITTVAGTGATAYNGDNRPATTANLTYPRDIFVDGSGNLFITEVHGHRVRRVDKITGLITTVAGTGTTAYNGDNRLATTANLFHPQAVFVDGTGNVFITEWGSHRVRRVDKATGIITTVAGTGTSGSLGDNGPATSAQLSGPLGMAVDNSGNMYIANHLSHRVRKIEGLVEPSTQPIANAGSDQTVDVGDTVQLDGSGSSDPNNDSLNYAWQLTGSPSGSSVFLSNTTAANPTFVPDVAGVYVVQLVVDDGTEDSDPDQVTITAAVSSPIVALQIGTATFSQGGFPASSVSDGISDAPGQYNGWAIGGGTTTVQTAVWETVTDLVLKQVSIH